MGKRKSRFIVQEQTTTSWTDVEGISFDCTAAAVRWLTLDAPQGVYRIVAIKREVRLVVSQDRKASVEDITDE